MTHMQVRWKRALIRFAVVTTAFSAWVLGYSGVGLFVLLFILPLVEDPEERTRRRQIYQQKVTTKHILAMVGVCLLVVTLMLTMPARATSALDSPLFMGGLYLLYLFGDIRRLARQRVEGAPKDAEQSEV